METVGKVGYLVRVVQASPEGELSTYLQGRRSSGNLTPYLTKRTADRQGIMYLNSTNAHWATISVEVLTVEYAVTDKVQLVKQKDNT